MGAVVYRFGAFELDEGLYQLRRDAEVVKLEPRVFDVLLHLVRNRDRVVSKAELLDTLWSGEAVSESVLPTNVAAVRRALRDDPVGRAAIQTVHGRGYRFVAEVAAGASRPAAPAPEVAPVAPRRPFVGRAGVMDMLRGALDQACAGSGRLLLLVGEPGIGKTRTCVELAQEARAAGFQVLPGRCHEGEGAPAFWPWIQILREATRDSSPAELSRVLGASAADLSELLPELTEKLQDVSPRPALDPENLRFRLFDAVTRLLEAQSRRAPMLLLLDDLHWADKATLLLLRFLARDLPEQAILVVGTYRDVEVRRGHPLAAIVGELSREPHCERLLLRGLTREDVAAFIEAAGHEADPATVDAVHEMTEGNPFFVGEIVELWERGVAPAPSRDRARRFGLPHGVREAIGRRLDALPDECGRVLRVAAALGREFRLPVLARAVELDTGELLARLDEARAAGIVEPIASGSGAYVFSHLLVRETLYDELATPERVRLHRRIAEILEELHGAESAHDAELAYHLFEAAPGGDVERAVGACERAALRAIRVLAYEEAALLYERALLALDLLPNVDDGRRCELLLALSEAQDHASEFGASRRSGRQAFELARGLDRPELIGRAALAVAGRFDLGPPYESECTVLEQGLEAVGDGDPALRIRLLGKLSIRPPYRDSMQTRLALSEEAVALARRTGDPETLLEALSGLGYPGLLGPEHDERRLEVAAEIEALARRTGHRERLARVHEDRMRSYLALGDIEAAQREVEAGRRVAESLRDHALAYFTMYFPVARAIAEGRFAEAEEEMRRSVAAGYRLAHDPEASYIVRGLFVFQAFCLTRLKDELHRLPEELRQYGESASFAGPIIETMIARAALGRGQRASARSGFEDIAARGFSDIPRDEWWMGTLGLLAELAADCGDAERATELYDLLLPFADRNVVFQLLRLYDGSASRFLGLLAETAGEPDVAVRHYADAAEANARMGARAPLVWTRLGRARALLSRAGAGDRDAAREELARCRELALECDMPALVRRAEALSAEAGL